jgi:hypothetical protein
MKVVMKKIFISLVILLAAAGGFLFAKVVAAFSELGKPENMVMDDHRIYIIERENIYIYSRDHYKLKTKFGKRGEGPREFMLVPHFQLALGVKTDRIAVYSMGKISHFTKDGVFISETKLKSTQAYDLRPFGDFFLGAVQAPDNDRMYNSAILYDAGLNKVKVLKRVESQFKGQGKGTHILENQLVFRAHGDKIFISDCDPFVIDVFDKKGNRLYSIKRKVEKVPVSTEFKNKVQEFFRTDPRYKDIYGYLQPITCADHFPAIQELFVHHNRLYAITWQKKGNNYRCLIFDTDAGKFIKEIDIPLHFKSNMVEPYPFSFWENTFYQLVDNPETEEWELHATSF